MTYQNKCLYLMYCDSRIHTIMYQWPTMLYTWSVILIDHVGDAILSTASHNILSVAYFFKSYGQDSMSLYF